MRIRVRKIWDYEFKKDQEELIELENDLNSAGLPIIKEEERGYIQLYTEINTIEELNKLVESFKCPIVYDVENGKSTAEKYDNYRE